MQCKETLKNNNLATYAEPLGYLRLFLATSLFFTFYPLLAEVSVSPQWGWKSGELVDEFANKSNLGISGSRLTFGRDFPYWGLSIAGFFDKWSLGAEFTTTGGYRVSSFFLDQDFATSPRLFVPANIAIRVSERNRFHLQLWAHRIYTRGTEYGKGVESYFVLIPLQRSSLNLRENGYQISFEHQLW